ncbi:MAG: adenylyltransferase/cytidyltransferase family protein [Thaumarchaeota archaeon]|nr:adenylyltransferase/cytidyltransferase family protein [Nitrososphaerota archaeon]
MKRKHVLAAVFSMGIKGEKANPKTLAAKLGLGVEEARSEVEGLSRLGLLRASDGDAVLTPKGRRSIRVVFIGGGFEVIHYGHVYTIDKARSLGDVLVVSVARDSTIRKRKKREPLVSEQDRVKLLSGLRKVDAAILGVEGDIYVTLQKVAPDVVALGYDQYHMEEEVKKKAAERGLKVRVVRLDSPYPNIKTSKLLNDF